MTEIDQHMRHSARSSLVNTFRPPLRLASFRGTADNSLKKLLSGLCVRCNEKRVRHSLRSAETADPRWSRQEPTPAMNDDNDPELKVELLRLQQEHRDLDAAIVALQQAPASDLLQM